MSTPFHIGKDTQVAPASMPFGIHENVELVSVKFENVSDKVSGNTIVFTFQNDAGQIHTHFEWELDFEKVKERNEKKPRIWRRGDKKNQPMTAEEQYNVSYQEMSIRIKHIASKFMPEDKIMIDAKDWTEYGNKVQKLFEKADKSVKVRLKLPYKYGSSYTKLPDYPPFIERMEDKATLAFSPKDNTKPATPDSETTHDGAEDVGGTEW